MSCHIVIPTFTEFNKASYERKDEIDIFHFLQILSVHVHNTKAFIYGFAFIKKKTHKH